MTKEQQKMKRCADCREGEHENYDENIKLVVVRDPNTNHLVRRAYMCELHREAWTDDGYTIT